jgi:hypothetical protein
MPGYRKIRRTLWAEGENKKIHMDLVVCFHEADEGDDGRDDDVETPVAAQKAGDTSVNAVAPPGRDDDKMAAAQEASEGYPAAADAGPPPPPSRRPMKEGRPSWLP